MVLSPRDAPPSSLLQAPGRAGKERGGLGVQLVLSKGDAWLPACWPEQRLRGNAS